MNCSIFTISFALFLLMDPIGNIPVYLAVLKNIDPKRQRKIIIRELLIALAVIVLFTFIGEYLLDIIEGMAEKLDPSQKIAIIDLLSKMHKETEKSNMKKFYSHSIIRIQNSIKKQITPPKESVTNSSPDNSSTSQAILEETYYQYLIM